MVNLHKRAPWEYAGHEDHATHEGPDVRPIQTPIPHAPAPRKSKRPTRTPDLFALGNASTYRRLGGE